MKTKIKVTKLSVAVATFATIAACGGSKEKETESKVISMEDQVGYCDLRESVVAGGKLGLCRENNRSVNGEVNWNTVCRGEGGYWTGGVDQRCPNAERLGTCTYNKGKPGQQVNVYFKSSVLTRDAAMQKCAEKSTFTPEGGVWAD